MGVRSNTLFSPAGFSAAEDLQAKQYCFVKPGATAWEVEACDTDGEDAVGVLQNDPDTGQGASVMFEGMTPIVIAANQTLAPGDKVTTTTAGHARKIAPTGTGADVGDYILGWVVEGGTAGGTPGPLATIMIQRLGRVTA